MFFLVPFLREYVLEGKLILGEWSTSPPRQKNERGIKMTVSDTLGKKVKENVVDFHFCIEKKRCTTKP